MMDPLAFQTFLNFVKTNESVSSQNVQWVR